MMVLELLSRLRRSGIELQLVGDRLRIIAPEGVLTPLLKEELSARKEEIIEFLKTAKGDALSTSRIPVYPRSGRLPLSFSQERLWFLDQLEPGNVAYNIPEAIRLKGVLNRVWLEQALTEILARHEVLRTNFDIVEDQPVQIIRAPQAFPLRVIDLCGLSEEEQSARVKQCVDEEARRPFDLREDLLIRASLLQLNEFEHIFLLTIHHIVSDAWSIALFSREFSSLYSGYAGKKSHALPLLPIQYADYACWQREWLKGERLETQLAYWKQQLRGELPPLDQLLDKPRPAIQSHKSGQATLSVSSELIQAVRHLCQQEDATLFMVLLAAFDLLLHRQTGLEDIVVGSPVAGRNRAETESLIGFFLNTLVLRTDVSGNPTFRELIQRVKKVAMDSYTHQDIPFEKILVELQPERDLSRTPFFHIFFNMLNIEGGAGQLLPDLAAESLGMPNIGAKFDLTLYLAERDNGIQVTAVYNSELFTAERIRELLSQYEFLLAQISADPDKTLNAYSLVTAKAKGVLPDPVLSLDASWHGPVHSRLSRNAVQFPTGVAIRDRLGTWTYQELDRRTNQLAHFLLAQGLKPQGIVAVYGYRNSSLVWAILGILKAGGAFLILDPAYPEARLLDYVNISAPQGLIQLEAAGPLSAGLKAWAGRVGSCKITLPDGLSAPSNILDSFPVSDPDVPVGPNDVAAISFTSGSSGKPKGVMGRHGPLSHFLPWQSEIFNLSRNDRFSMLSGLSHDPLQRDIFTALWVGASLHIPDSDHLGSPNWLRNWMYQEQITFSHFTPAMAQLLIASTSNDDLSERKLTSLRYAFFVGDKLTRRDVHQLGRIAPSVICINSYGLTETQRAVGYSLVDPKDFSDDRHVEQDVKAVLPVGRGMKNVQLLVLTNSQQQAGIGELGEIYVRSPHLAKGYLGDESLTAERFIINPFTLQKEDRLYKTGDLGRYLSDGAVEFLGRKDKQVKIRGFRVELGEVETILGMHPAIRQVIVNTWEPDHEDKRLTAYIVLNGESAPKPSELREFLRERIPIHMIPSNFVFLSAVPLTPNGKINYAELPPPAPEGREHNQGFARARDETEKALTKIWEELLHVNPIGIQDNFFELGGHSLLAVRLFSRIRKQFDVNLPLATLFQEATIEHLANIINHKIRPVAWSSLVEIESQGNHPPFFCVHGVTGDILWFRNLAQSLAPDFPFYGLQARGLDGLHEPFSKIEDMAAHYLEEIRRCQPKGPYHLGGASFGGTVALEIAQQFLRQGEEVALLAIFDHYPPNVKLDIDRKSFRHILMMSGRMLKNIPYWIKDFMQLSPSRIWMRIRRKLRLMGKTRGQSETGRPIEFDAMDLIDIAPELPSYRQRLITIHYQSMRKYTPLPYQRQVTLFRAGSRPLLNSYDPEWGWQKLAPGRVTVIDIPGSHEGMFMEPHVRTLAEKLKVCMSNPIR
ncbi:MAG: non-ribosomal peptide synthetase [Anaerolineae bacterium]|nr:MAG: non-ribosomal peptide synthetase [Anaerolineae bacterium]WKZ44876.1 MAG: amino acid adenylation domain-containing protein [Anaerolineales bacterium]